MHDYLEDKARDELKRVDHLVYVSLKYTRTCDVMMNSMSRMISAFEFGFNDLTQFYYEKKKIKDVPDSFKEKVEILDIVLKNKIKPYTKLYAMLKKIEVSEYARREEYRKHVTMIVNLEGKKMEINVPMLLEYYKKTKEFVELMKEVME